MAFDISYIFTARDKYTAIARKVAAANEKIKRSAATAARSLKTKLKPALDSVAASAQKMRNIGLGLSLAITLPIFLAARSAVKFAADAEETRSKFATVFRDIGQGAEDVADNFARNFGLAGATSRRLISDTGDLLTGFGFTQEGALELSRQVNELAVDLASFTNFSGGAEGASAAITKALLGERESLKSLGIAITEDLVDRKISLLLTEGQTFSSEAQAKAMATLAIAVDQSKNAIGDYARTQESAVNRSRLLEQKTLDLKEKYGNLLLPIQLKLTNAGIKFVGFLDNLSPTMQKAILIVGGLVAVLGPLLLVIAAIGFALPAMAAGIASVGTAITFLTGPVGIIIALTAAIITFLLTSKKVSNAVGGAIFKIVEAFKTMGEIVGGILARLVEFMNPLNFLAGILDKFTGAEIKQTLEANQLGAASNAVTTGGGNATINGQINVSASPGSQIDSVDQQTSFRGINGDVGLGATQ